MGLRHVTHQRISQRNSIILRNFFAMISTVIVLTSFALVILITSSNSTKSFAKQNKALVEVIK
jgi:hypothetical protein